MFTSSIFVFIYYVSVLTLYFKTHFEWVKVSFKYYFCYKEYFSLTCRQKKRSLVSH